MTGQTPPRGRHLPAGYDEDDPYEGEDLSTYPDWWRRNIEEFRAYNMRPYRPPRFTDGELLPEVIRTLERELSVDIRFRSVNPQEGSKWEVLLDDTPIFAVDRYREGEGYSLYDLPSTEFETRIRNAADTG